MDIAWLVNKIKILTLTPMWLTSIVLPNHHHTTRNSIWKSISEIRQDTENRQTTHTHSQVPWEIYFYLCLQNISKFEIFSGSEDTFNVIGYMYVQVDGLMVMMVTFYCHSHYPPDVKKLAMLYLSHVFSIFLFILLFLTMPILMVRIIWYFHAKMPIEEYRYNDKQDQPIVTIV